jgi:hypothetical protein
MRPAEAGSLSVHSSLDGEPELSYGVGALSRKGYEQDIATCRIRGRRFHRPDCGACGGPSATPYLERRERIQECMDPYRDHPKFAGQWQQAFLRRLCEMKVGTNNEYQK